ncbi:MAG TPA: glycosyltransferase family 4 protein [Stellaceae bacterium]|nr:glycosyltransferase family 4 protein [Stellaceae bacterium]
MIAIVAGLISGVGTRVLIPHLRRAGVAATPNERSLHAAPTPHGGGIALVGAVVAVWLAMVGGGARPVAELAILAGAVLLAVVSWLDDRYELSALARLIPQVLVVVVSLDLAPLDGPVFQGWLPPVLDRAASGLLWLWFINLFNFMDGADGLTGSEAVAIGVGIVLVVLPYSPPMALLGVAVAGAAIGFLVSNWAPAKVFMGDVGSIPLGYLIGFLLLGLAASGMWKAALILPLYFLADATITLGRRALRGEKVWQAHRQHFYQRAVLGGLSHAAMTSRVIAANLALIACAWAAENGYGVVGLGAACLVVAILLVVLARARYTLSP